MKIINLLTGKWNDMANNYFPLRVWNIFTIFFLLIGFVTVVRGFYGF